MKLLTYFAYLFFLAIGLNQSILGVVKTDMAKDFLTSSSKLVAIFSFFSIGVTLSIFFSSLVIKKLGVKKTTILSILLTFFGIVTLITIKSLILLPIVVFIYGFGLGFWVSIANIIILGIYSDNRDSKLNMLNFFFSLGFILGPLFSGLVLKSGVMSWKMIYGSMIVPLIMLMIVVFKIDEKMVHLISDSKKGERRKWSRGTYFIAGAIFFYVVSEVSIAIWLVDYMEKRYGFEIDLSAFTLSFFWIFMTVGRFLSGIYADRFETKKYIYISSLISIVGVAMLLVGKGNYLAFLAVGVAGFGYSALYALVLSVGVEKFKQQGTNILGFLLSMGSAGGILAPVLSGFIEGKFGVEGVILFAIFGIVILLLLVFMSGNREEVNVIERET